MAAAYRRAAVIHTWFCDIVCHVSDGIYDTWHDTGGVDVYRELEARGRAIVTRLGARWADERRRGDPAVSKTEDAFAQARAYQALLVGHVDFARTPCRPEDVPACTRGHVELIVAVLRLMDRLSRDRAGRSGGGASARSRPGR
jgi:hypothetical protein